MKQSLDSSLATAGPSPATEPLKPKDRWDKLDIFAKVLGAVMTATVTLVVAFIGANMNKAIAKSGNEVNKTISDLNRTLQASQLDASNQLQHCQLRTNQV